MEAKDLEGMTKEKLIELLMGLQQRINDSDEDRKALREDINEIKAAIKEKEEKKKKPKGFLETLFSVEVE